MKFFSPDSKMAQILTSFGEMLLLNLCWIIGCLPLLTIGAANTAMYTMMGRRLRREGSGTIVPFFKALWSNLKPATLFWVIQVIAAVSTVMTLSLPVARAFKIVSAAVMLLMTLLFSIVYPQLARFQNSWFGYFRNAMILLVLKLGWVLLNAAVLASPVIFFLLAPAEFLRLGVVWILFGFSLLFYLSAKIAQKILQPIEDLGQASNMQ